ncbi:phospholipase [Alicycliphilus denitrificans]|uniref:Phospholipase/Carboxylesterase n=3 Tax=Alicycliphilus denitrificans TaxID=179636 RepID=F4GB82_ALIDK|nr:phospholipase/Carboxylesterase [Alicycliphilus denitrificans BC]AEB84658.1 phospholipase/Carboxylesterase [Alicycliphilus denitrificans K601]QKD44386.1 phospholipase [Alicycliphilus denitrificans]GAO23564.1 phospholipase [Alicycliphilus sp. B1]
MIAPLHRDTPAMLDLPFTCLHRPANSAVRHPWLLVLMHGVGSNEHDLFGLTPQIPEHFHVLSLRAPFRMGPGAFAWFDFSIEPGGERTIDEAQEAHSRALLEQAVPSAARQLGVEPGRTVVGGFSQGGIMALSLLLTRPGLMHAGLVWHGRLLAQAVPYIASADAFHGKHLRVSHGTHDNVIPLAHAQAIRRQVQALPLHLSYEEFAGAHEIRQAELAHTVAWLQGLSGAA